MWIRKSEEEIQQLLMQKEEAKKNLVRPLLFAAGIGIVLTLLYSLGVRGCVRGVALVSQRPDGFNSRTIFAGLFMFAMFAAIAIYRQRKLGSFWGGEEFARCSRCTETAHVNPDKICFACGGEQEPTDFYSWIEDEDVRKEVILEVN